MSRVIRSLMLCGTLAGVTVDAVAETPRRSIRQTSATLLEPEFAPRFDDDADEPSFEQQPFPRSGRFRDDQDDYSTEAPNWELPLDSRDNDLESPLGESPSDIFFNCDEQSFEWQVLPPGLMYQSYLAGPKEPRFNTLWLRDRNGKLNWETSMGGRIGILRYGTRGVIFPQGWQLDMEGASQTRVLPQQQSDLEAVDFRFGILSTWRRGAWAVKAGYYHISSHLGDEFLLTHPGYPRLNYVRDSLVTGVSYDVLLQGRPDVRVYGEVAYAAGHEGGALPLEFQFGSEYSPFLFNGLRGMPFAAVNWHVREDHNWTTGRNVVAGWQWRGEDTNHRYRIGLQYYNGPSLQFAFSGQTETVFGWGMWFDY